MQVREIGSGLVILVSETADCLLQNLLKRRTLLFLEPESNHMRLFEGTELDRPPRCERCNELESDCSCPVPEAEAIPASKQTARIQVEKRKKGKVVTVIRGLNEGHPGKHLTDLLTSLKNSCGAGGTIHDVEIEIQGNHLERLKKILKDMGFKVRG